MDTRELEQLREHLEAAYQEKLDALEAEHKQDLEAYERLWRAMSGNGDKAMPTGHLRSPHVRSLHEAVKAVVPYAQGKFDINVIIRLILERHPEIKTPINPTSVSGILRTLEKKGELKLAKRGAGKRPSIYQAPRGDVHPKGLGSKQ